MLIAATGALVSVSTVAASDPSSATSAAGVLAGVTESFDSGDVSSTAQVAW